MRRTDQDALGLGPRPFGARPFISSLSATSPVQTRSKTEATNEPLESEKALLGFSPFRRRTINFKGLVRGSGKNGKKDTNGGKKLLYCNDSPKG